MVRFEKFTHICTYLLILAFMWVNLRSGVFWSYSHLLTQFYSYLHICSYLLIFLLLIFTHLILLICSYLLVLICTHLISPIFAHLLINTLLILLMLFFTHICPFLLAKYHLDSFWCFLVLGFRDRGRPAKKREKITLDSFILDIDCPNWKVELAGMIGRYDEKKYVPPQEVTRVTDSLYWSRWN